MNRSWNKPIHPSPQVSFQIAIGSCFICHGFYHDIGLSTRSVPDSMSTLKNIPILLKTFRCALNRGEKSRVSLSTLIHDCRILENFMCFLFFYIWSYLTSCIYVDKDTQASRRHQKIRRDSLDEKRVGSTGKQILLLNIF